MVRLAQNEIHFGEFIPLDSVVEKIDAVTAEGVRDLANRLFDPRQMALTLLGPVKDKSPYEDLLAL